MTGLRLGHRDLGWTLLGQGVFGTAEASKLCQSRDLHITLCGFFYKNHKYIIYAALSMGRLCVKGPLIRSVFKLIEDVTMEKTMSNPDIILLFSHQVGP